VAVRDESLSFSFAALIINVFQLAYFKQNKDIAILLCKLRLQFSSIECVTERCMI